MKYVTTKFMKRMASSHVQDFSQASKPCLLVPISLGVSSVTLLYLLDKRLHEKTSRFSENGHAIHVLYVDISAVEPGSPAPNLLENIVRRFPQHQYSVAPIEDIFNHYTDPFEKYPEYETILSSQLQDFSGTNRDKLENCLSTLPSATSRSDALQILRNRLIVQFARNHSYKSIVWGDTTTRLAEKTLSETAKGRGLSIPWHISESASSLGVTFHYPLRDLLRKEIVAFSALTPIPLTSLIASQSRAESSPAPARSMTIDDLMAQYFGPVEETYPNIVANVVNTASKLKAPTTMADAQKPNGS